MKKSDLYQKIIVWSVEDNCFVGMCPELMYGGVHGDDPIKVYRELSEVVDEVIELYEKDGDPLPEPKGIEIKQAA